MNDEHRGSASFRARHHSPLVATTLANIAFSGLYAVLGAGAESPALAASIALPGAALLAPNAWRRASNPAA